MSKAVLPVSPDIYKKVQEIADTELNQLSFKHSSRSLPMKLSA